MRQDMQRGKCTSCPHYQNGQCNFRGEPSDVIDLRLYAKAIIDKRISFEPVEKKPRKPRATRAEMEARRAKQQQE